MTSSTRVIAAVAVAGAAVLATSHAALGADPLMCAGHPVTIEAADGAIVHGTSGDDVIAATGSGQVTVYGEGGSDVICVGNARGTYLSGGPGDDELWGGPQHDYFSESGADGDGSDAIHGGVGDSLAYGPGFLGLPATPAVTINVPAGIVAGHGSDTISGPISAYYGTGSADTFVGSGAAESYYSSGGADSIRTGGGDDVVTSYGGGTIATGDGDDHVVVDRSGQVSGGAGNDVLEGTIDLDNGSTAPFGVFRFDGGPGDDRLVPHASVLYGYADAPDWIGTLAGGSGRDTVVFTYIGSGATVNLTADTFRWKTGHGDVPGVERVLGSNRADHLVGGAGANYLRGRGGRDVLTGRGGRDVLLGGAGFDKAYGGPGRDRCRAEREYSC